MRIVAPLLVLPLLAACGAGSAPSSAARTEPVVAAPPAATAGTATTSSEPTAATAARTTSRAVYYLHDGGKGIRLYRELHRRPATTGVVRDAVTAMLAEKPVDRDYTSLWPRTTTLRGVRISGTTAYVDLSGEARKGNGGAEAERMSLQQLVHTVTAAAPAVKRVQLLVAGTVVPDLWGHVDTRRPIARDPSSEVLGPVWLLTPANGRVARGGTFGGQATVFEATVSWQIVKAGKVVRTGFATASTGAPGRGSWSAKADVPPGSYVVRAFESSAEDGSETWVDDKPLTVT